jgi:uncharacterized phage infection (PIP) family protein YhgE
MKMKFLLPVVLIALIVTSCGSGVDIADMQKQEEKAREQLKAAQEEMVELANMKEQYSVDNREAMIKKLEKQQKQIGKDIKSFEKVETSSAQGAASSAAESLEQKNKQIEKEIKDLKNGTKEKWEEARVAINDRVDRLRSEIDKITQGLEEDKERMAKMEEEK